MKKTLLPFMFAALVPVMMFAGGQGDSAEMTDDIFFDQTVKIIIPYGAGGTHDVVARKFDEVGSRYTNAPIVCVQETGGDGLVAAINFTTKKPNVRELLTTSYGLWYQKIVKGDAINLDLSKINPIGIFDDRSYLLYVRGDSPYQNLDELVAESKKREIILSAGAVGADALLNGETDVFVGTSQVGKQYLELGQVRAIATFKNFDFDGFKDELGLVVPNVADARYPQSAITGGGMLRVVAGTKESYAQDVEDLMKKVWADPDASAE